MNFDIKGKLFSSKGQIILTGELIPESSKEMRFLAVLSLNGYSDSGPEFETIFEAMKHHFDTPEDKFKFYVSKHRQKFMIRVVYPQKQK